LPGLLDAMKPFRIPSLGRRLIAAEDEPVEPLRPPQAIGDRGAEAARVLKRLMVIAGDHARSARALGIELQPADLRAVIGALRDHARGGSGLPVPGARDAIHAHVLDRFFEELVEEPSNVLFATRTGQDSIRYDAMEPDFWIECLDLMERTLCTD
jgi:hypothetical protein